MRRSQGEKGGGHVPVAITNGLGVRKGHYLSIVLALSTATTHYHQSEEVEGSQ